MAIIMDQARKLKFNEVREAQERKVNNQTISLQNQRRPQQFTSMQ
jgi:hypothetical protein